MEVIALLIWVACAAYCYSVALKKNLNVALWTVLGVLLGFFAVIIVTVVPSKA